MAGNEALANSVSAGACVAAPGSGATVVTLGVLPAGVYRVTVVTQNAGTAETTAAGLVNMILRKGSTTLSALHTTSLVAHQRVERITVDGTQSINVATAAAAIAGSLYVATLSAVRIQD